MTGDSVTELNLRRFFEQFFANAFVEDTGNIAVLIDLNDVADIFESVLADLELAVCYLRWLSFAQRVDRGSNGWKLCLEEHAALSVPSGG